jgi:hypothetical protein
MVLADCRWRCLAPVRSGGPSPAVPAGRQRREIIPSGYPHRLILGTDRATPAGGSGLPSC